jgi:hypothetical protein
MKNINNFWFDEGSYETYLVDGTPWVKSMPTDNATAYEHEVFPGFSYNVKE